MRRIPVLFVAALLAACSPGDQAVPEAMPEAAALTLADFAGTWQYTTTLTGVETPVSSTVHASGTSSEWTMDLEGRPGIPMQASIVGDSLITQSAEYESILRPGVMVTVRTAGVLQDGMLMGNMVATYRTKAGEEVVPGTVHGKRVQ